MNLIFWMAMIFTAAILFHNKWISDDAAARKVCAAAESEAKMQQEACRRREAALQSIERSRKNRAVFVTMTDDELLCGAPEGEEERIELMSHGARRSCEIYNLRGQRVA